MTVPYPSPDEDFFIEFKADDVAPTLATKDLFDRGDSPWIRISHLLSKARINIQLKDFTVARECFEAVRSFYRDLGLENGTVQLRAIEKEIEEKKSDGR